ncbi:hypothetical protein ACJMK2_010529 [Sinanodonta woodiana]|uniref:BZIP domain-containing protein n=1 Tax=Sinanodonta woodiana TaxID=1069815 RepID=A0ABD3VFN6_SINWO
MPQKRVMSDDDSFSQDSEDGHFTATKGKKSRMQEKGKDGEDYKKRRERNNLAVKKSREKSRQKARETVEQVHRLRAENEMLEQKVQILSKELSVLKDLFLAHAGTVAEGDCQVAPSVNDHQYSASLKEEN